MDINSQRTVIADRDRRFRRSKYIRKSRAAKAYVPLISRRFYGHGSIVVKLHDVNTMNISSGTSYTAVFGLASLARSSNDWLNYKQSYALFNIINVTCKIQPQCWPYSAGLNRQAGICYDTKDNEDLGDMKSVMDHLSHKVMNFSNGHGEYIFSVRPKATKPVPQSTAVNDESWGYIKNYAKASDFGNTTTSVGNIYYTLTVVFSNQQ